MTKKAKLIIDGKEIEVEITQEQLDKLCPPKKKTGYEKVEDRNNSRENFYFYVDRTGIVESTKNIGMAYDDAFYDNANYYSHYAVAKNNARADKLMRQLRRFAVEHREKELDWHNDNQTKWYISYRNTNKSFNVYLTYIVQDFGKIYFDTKETAQLAIDTFKDELLWYFTEYKDSL